MRSASARWLWSNRASEIAIAVRERGGSSGLRAVVALHNDEVDVALAAPLLLCRFIFRRTITGVRCGVVGKLDHHVTGSDPALWLLGGATAHQKARAIFAERDRVRGLIVLVAFQIGHIHVRDPIALGHTASS